MDGINCGGGVILRALIEGGLLRFPIGDIRNLRAHGINCGYPIMMLVMACMETMGELLSYTPQQKWGAKDKEAISAFAHQLLVRVNPLYGTAFRRVGINSDPTPLIVLLYYNLRCKLMHNANAIEGFPVEARPELQHLHLAMKANGSILIHAFRLFDDFMTGLELLYARAACDSVYSANLVQAILEYRTRLEGESSALLETLLGEVCSPEGVSFAAYPLRSDGA